MLWNLQYLCYYVEITHIQNRTSTYICYSKCKILKIISPNEWGQSLDTHKMFPQTFRPKSYDYHDYINTWYYTFFFRPFDYLWFFLWGDEMQNQNDFPIQEWWLFLFFFCAIKDIFCPQILEWYKYFNEHGSNLIPTSCFQLLFFLSRFQIPWIVGWDFILTQMILTHSPAHLAREFKVKWWSNFSHSATQQIHYIKNWISSKKCSFKVCYFKISFSNQYW